MADFFIATEDRLSEAIAERLIAHTGHKVAAKIPKDRRKHSGFGYLRTRLPDFINSCSGGINFFLLTDLDTLQCPSLLLADWLGNAIKPENLLLRVAVKEVEAWVLADRVSFAHWIEISETCVPTNPEASTDPKSELLNLAATSRNRVIKEGLLPKRGAPTPVGLEYNDLLCDFVATRWQITIAATVSTSLNRALNRLKQFRHNK